VLRHRGHLLGVRGQLVAQEAVNAVVLSARHLCLKVHPDDLPLVAEGAAEPLAARQVRLVADAAVARGGCVVDSDLGRVDAQVERRWTQALDVLGRDEPLEAAP
jgi:flagellar assembly protein FliH